MLLAFQGDGRLTHAEWFDPERASDALARFDALTAGPPAAAPTAAPVRAVEKAERRVRSNAATANAAAMEAALAARNEAAFPALFSEDTDTLSHLTGTRYGLEGALTTFRSVLKARDLSYRLTPIATLGSSLALCRQAMSASGVTGKSFDVGAYERQEINLIEVDASGRRRRSEWFPTDRLANAVIRLYERHAELLPDGPNRTRAASTARSVAAALGPYDTDAYSSVHAPAIEYFDHRAHGVGPLTGVEAVRRWFHSLLEVADDVGNRMDDVLELRSDALLMRWTNFGIERAGGGSYERHFLWLGSFGADGLLTRIELFEGDHDAEALARFDELTAEPPARLIENAATRQADQVSAAWAARDWKRLAQLFPAGGRYVDRKRMTQTGDLDRGQQLEWMRPLFEMRSSRLVQAMLATRGDRLALSRERVEVADRDIGPSEIGSLGIIEVDAHGERVATIRFDPEDVDAAYAELDARYHAGEAAPHATVAAGMQEFKRAFTERDWDALAARCAPDIVVHDRRLLGWETLHGPAAYVEALRTLVELAPDTRLRIDHTTICAHGYLVITVWEGTREGGAYEAPSLMVAELDGQRQIRRFDQYDLERLDQARARFAELRPDPLRIPPNAATRSIDRWREAFEARDWPALEALCAPSSSTKTAAA